jgi:hypothetical protein
MGRANGITGRNMCQCNLKEGWSGIKPVPPTATQTDQCTTFHSLRHKEHQTPVIQASMRRASLDLHSATDADRLAGDLPIGSCGGFDRPTQAKETTVVYHDGVYHDGVT